jgi:predicted transcriptional regulator
MPTVRDNRWTARQMASRGVSVADIAARLEITDSAVRQLLKEAS